MPVVDYGGVKLNKNEYTVTYKVSGNVIDNKTKLPEGMAVGSSVKVDVSITANKKNYEGEGPTVSYTITRVNPVQNLSKAKLLIRKKGDDSFKRVSRLNFTGKAVVIGEGEFEDYELYVYMGKNVKDTAKKKLEAGKDYTVSYSNNLKAGRATVIINAKEGNGIYFGSKALNFNIVKGKMKWVKK
ncbi:MAG: hypothetical protein J6P45_01820 [Lachnospiraceae bacterium]|nr:hypothetical protein [Lachnospiraceae bacterium]